MKIRRLKSLSSWADVDENRSPLLAHSDHFIPTQKTNAASKLIGFILSHLQRPHEAGRETESLRTVAMEAVRFGSADIQTQGLGCNDELYNESWFRGLYWLHNK